MDTEREKGGLCELWIQKERKKVACVSYGYRKRERRWFVGVMDTEREKEGGVCELWIQKERKKVVCVSYGYRKRERRWRV